TRLGSFDWKTTESRVRPPSTGSSMMRSASAIPVCGRAPGSFATLTTSGRRWIALASLAGVPRSGHAAGPTATLSGDAHDDAKSAMSRASADRMIDRGCNRDADAWLGGDRLRLAFL